MRYIPYITDPELETICFFPMDTNEDLMSSSAINLGTNTTFSDTYPLEDVAKSLTFVDETAASVPNGNMLRGLDNLEEGTIVIWYTLSGASIQPLFAIRGVAVSDQIRVYISGSNRIHYEKLIDGTVVSEAQFCRHGGGTFTDNKWHSLTITFTKTRTQFYCNSSWSYTLPKSNSFLGDIVPDDILFGYGYIEVADRFLHGSLSCFSISKKVFEHSFIEDIIGLNKISTYSVDTLYKSILEGLNPYIYYPLEDMLWETHRNHTIIHGQPTNGDPDFSPSLPPFNRIPMYPDADESIRIVLPKRLYSNYFNTDIMDAEWSMLLYTSVYCAQDDSTYLVSIPADAGGDHSLILYVNSSGFLTCELRLSDNSIITLGTDITLSTGTCGSSLEEDDTQGPKQILIAFDGTDYTIVVDGVLKGTVTNSLLLSQVSSELIVGGLTKTSSESTYYFDISSLAFFITAVTPEDLEQTVVVGNAYDSIILADSPVAYYRLDEAY